MTDITDQDRRAAREWAKNWQGDLDADTSAAARVILATVDAPAPTLPEELRTLNIDDLDEATLDYLADRAEKMEQDRDDARAEVERLTGERFEKEVRDTIDTHYAAQKGAESNAESNAESIDPADVKPGEAWIVECNEERRTAVKDRNSVEPWSTVNADGWYLSEGNGDITLVSRLVPAPRVITNPDELERLAEGVVIATATGIARVRQGWYWLPVEGAGPRVISAGVSLPVTVLWEPEA